MFNPFVKMDERYIPYLVKAKKFYLVAQVFKDAVDHFSEDKRLPILLSQYEDKGLAEDHVERIKKHDKKASLYDMQNVEHVEKLRSRLTPESGFDVYLDSMKSEEEVIKRLGYKYQNNIRRWVSVNTSWHVPKDYIFEPSLETEFGRLMMVLAYFKKKERLPLEVIEKA